MNVRKKGHPGDPRVLRSKKALGDALVQLLHEQHFDDITVQSILERADVGRATFYAHYRNKRDVLHSGYEQLFVHLGGLLEQRSPAATRLVPAAEFLEHMRQADVFIASLRGSEQLDQISELTVAYVADLIKRRIAPCDTDAAVISPVLLSRMLAGAFVEMVRWWMERPTRETPARMDAMFHSLAGTILERSRYAVASGGRR